MTNDELPDPDFEQEYLDGYEGPLENCPNCGKEYDDIDFDYQICSRCHYNAETKSFSFL
jgi:hypothetical protein